MKTKKRHMESVFTEDTDFQNNARINLVPDSLELYAMGYKKAGDVVSEYAMKHEEDLDTLIYPSAFAYRQYIELRLKEVIKEGQILLGQPSLFPEGHDIIKLWRDAKKIVLTIWPNNPQNLDYSEHVIKEFAKIDPESFSFRYHLKTKNKGGGKTLEGINFINIRRLAEHVNKLEKDLEAISEGIAIYRQQQEG